MRGTALLKHRQSAVPHKHQSSELKSLWTQGKQPPHNVAKAASKPGSGSISKVQEAHFCSSPPPAMKNPHQRAGRARRNREEERKHGARHTHYNALLLAHSLFQLSSSDNRPLFLIWLDPPGSWLLTLIQLPLRPEDYLLSVTFKSTVKSTVTKMLIHMGTPNYNLQTLGTQHSWKGRNLHSCTNERLLRSSN